MWKDITAYFANFDDAVSTCRSIALWITIAFLVAFVATRLYIAVAAKKQRYGTSELAAAIKLINGGWIVAALVLAVCFIVTFTSCYFVDVAHGADYLFPILFYPMLVAAVAVVASAIALFVKPTVLVKIICAAVCGSALVAVIVCITVYYSSGKAGEALSNLGLYLSAIFLAAAMIVAAFFCDRKSKPIDTRTVTYAAVCVSLAFALSYVRLFKMPMGGSITFASMLPLMLFAFIFGSRKGVAVGVIYGLLQAIQDPWIIHPAQFALDYLVAFGAIGLTGCIREIGAFKGNLRAQFALGAVVACAVRFVSHYFAGVFAFGMYGEVFASQYGIGALANEYFYSFVYQCMYLIPELAIVIAASMLVLSSSTFRKQIEVRAALASKDGKIAVSSPDLPENDCQSDATVEQTGDNRQ